jgi:hypothetical protein
LLDFWPWARAGHSPTVGKNTLVKKAIKVWQELSLLFTWNNKIKKEEEKKKRNLRKEKRTGNCTWIGKNKKNETETQRMIEVAMIFHISAQTEMFIAVNRTSYFLASKLHGRNRKKKLVVNMKNKHHNHIYFAPNFSAIGTVGTTTW